MSGDQHVRNIHECERAWTDAEGARTTSESKDFGKQSDMSIFTSVRRKMDLILTEDSVILFQANLYPKGYLNITTRRYLYKKRKYYK
jgi:hypothetical protein